jgi:hypothetical protein
MNKVDITVREIVGMIERGELRLPEMQRQYVWRAPRVRDLLDSLYRGYPSGSILVWETEKERPTRDLAVAQQSSPFAGHKLLLDGQQRLTSLSAVLRGEAIRVRGRKREIDILFNLDHPDAVVEYSEVVADEESPLEAEGAADEREEEEEADELTLPERLRRMTFVVASKALAQQPNWISVTRAFCAGSDAEILKGAGVTSLDDPRYERYSVRLKKLRAIRDYPYVMHVLPRDLSYEEVAEIFVRVNSLGAKLRGSDLALAQITARWPNSLRLLEEFQDECEQRWMTLDLGLLVRSMVVFATGQCKFERVSALAADRLKRGWEDAKNGLRFAINFLRANADIEDESLLSSPMFFVTVAYFAHVRGQQLDRNEECDLLYWLYVANSRGHYSRGSSETFLDEDLALLNRGSGVPGMMDALRRQVGRLDVEAGDFIGRGPGNPLFSLVFLALRAQGARDWTTGLGISLTHQGRAHYIQYHHIFPKALLRDRYGKQAINEIANMAFVSGKLNRQLGASGPAAYLPGVIEQRGPEALEQQAVPTAPALWDVELFPEFLDARRHALAAVVRQFLAGARGAPTGASVEPTGQP